jgi:hypothetical protein
LLSKSPTETPLGPSPNDLAPRAAWQKKNEKKTSETLTKTNLSSASWETKHEKIVLNICFISLKEHILKQIKHINID